MEKTSFKIFIFGLTISILIFVGLFIYSLNSDKEYKIAVEYVNNPIMFFTVESCVNKYVTFLSSGDSEAVYNIMDKKYIKENNITINNALANNINLNGIYSFSSKAMLEDINEKYKYYVRGYLIKEEMDVSFENSEKKEYELIVKLDVENNTYSIIPVEVGEYFDAI